MAVAFKPHTPPPVWGHGPAGHRRAKSTVTLPMSFNVPMSVAPAAATGDAIRPAASRSAAAAAIVVGVVVAASVAAVFLAVQGAAPDEWPLQRVLNIAAGWLFILAGALLIREPAQRTTGVLLAVGG